ncbi:hypothetical protein D3C77_382370 [compost metagenome]
MPLVKLYELPHKHGHGIAIRNQMMHIDKQNMLDCRQLHKLSPEQGRFGEIERLHEMPESLFRLLRTGQLKLGVRYIKFDLIAYALNNFLPIDFKRRSEHLMSADDMPKSRDQPLCIKCASKRDLSGDVVN